MTVGWIYFKRIPSSILFLIYRQSSFFPLNRATYWTLDDKSTCFDSYGSKYNCNFQFAFCKQLPPKVVGQTTGIGAAQLSDKPGSQQVLLGGLSQFEQNHDGELLNDFSFFLTCRVKLAQKLYVCRALFLSKIDVFCLAAGPG